MRSSNSRPIDTSTATEHSVPATGSCPIMKSKNASQIGFEDDDTPLFCQNTCCTVPLRDCILYASVVSLEDDSIE